MFDLNYVHDKELLYRGIQLFAYETLQSRITSAAFKGQPGEPTSVDRDGQRPEDEIVASLQRKLPEIKAIVTIFTGFCREIGVIVTASPHPSNKYHADIRESMDKEKICKSKLIKLSKKAIIVKKY